MLKLYLRFCDAHESRLEGGNRFGGCFDIFKTRFFLRREHLEGKAHLVLLQDVDNLHKFLRGGDAAFDVCVAMLCRGRSLCLCKYLNSCINVNKIPDNGNGDDVNFLEG